MSLYVFGLKFFGVEDFSQVVHNNDITIIILPISYTNNTYFHQISPISYYYSMNFIKGNSFFAKHFSKIAVFII